MSLPCPDLLPPISQPEGRFVTEKHLIPVSLSIISGKLKSGFDLLCCEQWLGEGWDMGLASLIQTASYSAWAEGYLCGFQKSRGGQARSLSEAESSFLSSFAVVLHWVAIPLYLAL